MDFSGNDFRDMLVDYIHSWNEPLEVLKEINVGYRFVNTPRRLDIVIRNKKNNRFMAIECKLQVSPGTAYEKLSYALDDCLASPIPTILAFGGSEIKEDMKSKLILSGHGIEISLEKAKDGKSYIMDDKNNLFRQRCYIELGLNWFPIATGQHVTEQLEDMDN